MSIDPPVIAGAISTFMFGSSMMPMLIKAFRTRDLRSYSLGNILLANSGNAVHSIYVFSLPPGPIWLLHSFHTLTTAMMLFWYLRYEGRPAMPWRRAVAQLGAAIARILSAARRDPLGLPGSEPDIPMPAERAG